MNQDSNPPLYFHCNMCGECCSSWNIPIEGDKALQLQQKPWVKARLAEVNRSLVHVADNLYRIPLTDQNICVFLAEDKRCMIETKEGLRLKPDECQRFPFAKIRMPDGTTRHESSAACKLISEKLLLAFQPILPKPSPISETSVTLEAFQHKEAEQFEETSPFPSRVAVGLGRVFSVAEYAAYESSLQRILSSDRDSATVLKQVQAYLHRKKNSASNLAGLPDAFQYAPWVSHWLTLFFLRKPYRSLSWFSLLLSKTYDDPRIFGLPVHLRQQRLLPWNAAHNRQLNAFLFSILQRKRLLSSGGSLASLLAMAAIASLLVQWYAKTLAWLQASSEISALDVSTAIRLVERYYTGHQPRFLQFFTCRWKGECIEKLLLGCQISPI